MCNTCTYCHRGSFSTTKINDFITKLEGNDALGDKSLLLHSRLLSIRLSFHVGFMLPTQTAVAIVQACALEFTLMLPRFVFYAAH